MAATKVVFPGIKDVVSAPLVTTVFWDDGTFTMVKYDEISEPYSEKYGVLWCIAKKALGTGNVIKAISKVGKKK